MENSSYTAGGIPKAKNRPKTTRRHYYRGNASVVQEPLKSFLVGLRRATSERIGVDNLEIIWYGLGDEKPRENKKQFEAGAQPIRVASARPDFLRKIMAGTFQTDRAIFGNPVWKNIIDFRLFIFLYGNALFGGSQKYNAVEVRRGQFLRSYRKLAADLEYTEHNTIKQYSLHALKDSIDRLVGAGRIGITETTIGTLFTVKNYNEYQTFNGEQGNTLGNSTGTAREQHGNNKKKEKKEKKENTTTAPDKPAADGGGLVNWDNCRSPQQKLAAHYLKIYSPDIYKRANPVAVKAFFSRFGTALSDICNQCSNDVPVIVAAFDLCAQNFQKNQLAWTLDTVAKHISDYYSPALKLCGSQQKEKQNAQ